MAMTDIVTDLPRDWTWTCGKCGAEHERDALACPKCYHAKYPNWDAMRGTHIMAAVEDGLENPLDILKYCLATGAYQPHQLSLQTVAQNAKYLTRDTRKIARARANHQADAMMADVITNGDTKDKLTVLKGIGVLGEGTEGRGLVVQIGVSASEVKMLVVAAPAPETETES